MSIADTEALFPNRFFQDVGDARWLKRTEVIPGLDDIYQRKDEVLNPQEWVLPSLSGWTKTGADSFTVTGDHRDIFYVGRQLKIVMSSPSATFYDKVETVAYSSGTGLTTVTLENSVMTSTTLTYSEFLRDSIFYVMDATDYGDHSFTDYTLNAMLDALGSEQREVILAPGNWLIDSEGFSAWQSGHTYTVGDRVRPTTANRTTYWYECTTGGTSGGSEPVWGTTLAGTTSDNGIVWTCCRGVSFPSTMGISARFGTKIKVAGYSSVNIAGPFNAGIVEIFSKYEHTTVKTTAIAGAVNLDVNSIYGLSAGMHVWVTLDDGTLHHTTVYSIIDVDTIRLTNAIPTGRSAQATAIIYTWGAVTFGDDVNGAPYLEEVYPQWFGAKHDGVSYDSMPWQWSMNSLPKPGGRIAHTGGLSIWESTVYWPYDTSSLISYAIAIEGVQAYPHYGALTGISAKPSRINYTGTGVAIEAKGTTGVVKTLWTGTLSNLSIFGSVSPTNVISAASDFSSGWTTTGWSIAGGKATHSAGNTNALSGTTTVQAATWYRVAFVLEGCTTGSCVISCGVGNTTATLTSASNGTTHVHITSNAALSNILFTPTTDFDGTISVITMATPYISTSIGLNAEQTRLSDVEKVGFYYFGTGVKIAAETYYSKWDTVNLTFCGVGMSAAASNTGNTYHNMRVSSCRQGLSWMYSWPAVTISGSYFEACSYCPVYLSSQSGVEIKGCYFENNDSSVVAQLYVTGDGFYRTALSISNTIFSDNEGRSYALYISGLNFLKIHDCEMLSYKTVTALQNLSVYMTSTTTRGSFKRNRGPQINNWNMVNPVHYHQFEQDDSFRPIVSHSYRYVSYSRHHNIGDVVFNDDPLYGLFGGMAVGWLASEGGRGVYGSEFSASDVWGGTVTANVTEGSNKMYLTVPAGKYPYQHINEGLSIQIDNGGTPLTFSKGIGGDSTTGWDITNPTGTTFRYAWSGVGTHPGTFSGNIRIGDTVRLYGSGFHANNQGSFTITGIGSVPVTGYPYLEVTNASGVEEAGVLTGTGYLSARSRNYAIITGFQYDYTLLVHYALLDRVADASVATGTLTHNVVEWKSLYGLSLYKSVSDVAITGTTTADQTIWQVTLPNQVLSTDTILVVEADGTKTGTAGTKTIKLWLGATSVTLLSGSAGDVLDWQLRAKVVNTSLTTQKILYTFINGGTVTNGVATATIDTNYSTTLKVTVTLGNAGDTVTGKICEILPR